MFSTSTNNAPSANNAPITDYIDAATARDLAAQARRAQASRSWLRRRIFSNGVVVYPPRTVAGHRQNWAMPPLDRLHLLFLPQIANDIYHRTFRVTGRCFCSNALYAAQVHIARDFVFDLGQHRATIRNAELVLRTFLKPLAVQCCLMH